MQNLVLCFLQIVGIFTMCLLLRVIFSVSCILDRFYCIHHNLATIFLMFICSVRVKIHNNVDNNMEKPAD